MSMFYYTESTLKDIMLNCPTNCKMKFLFNFCTNILNKPRTLDLKWLMNVFTNNQLNKDISLKLSLYKPTLIKIFKKFLKVL